MTYLTRGSWQCDRCSCGEPIEGLNIPFYVLFLAISYISSYHHRSGLTNLQRRALGPISDNDSSSNGTGDVLVQSLEFQVITRAPPLGQFCKWRFSMAWLIIHPHFVRNRAIAVWDIHSPPFRFHCGGQYKLECTFHTVIGIASVTQLGRVCCYMTVDTEYSRNLFHSGRAGHCTVLESHWLP